MAVRAPHLYRSLRGFALGAFRAVRRRGLPFAFEEHESFGRPALYEYRPLVRTFIESRASPREARGRTLALDDLRREPAARIFARAHAGRARRGRRALPHRRPAAADLDRRRLRRLRLGRPRVRHAYAELEHSLFGKGHAYAAVAPLVGISVGTLVDLGDGVRVRNAATGELAAHWPEAQGLLPPDFGRETDRLCVRRARAQPAQGRARGA